MLDYEYFSNHCKTIAIDLQTNKLENPDLKQQVNCTGKLEEDNGATIFFIIEKSEETTLNFARNFVSII